MKMADSPYCVWCGRNVGAGHESECPVTGGLKPDDKGYVAFNWKYAPVKGPQDTEYNMHVCRMAMLMNMHKDVSGKIIFGLKDEEQQQRLAYEAVKYMLQKFAEEYLPFKTDPSKGPEEFNKYKKRMIDLDGFADAMLREDRKNELMKKYDLRR